jgi:hypothetical protein
MHSANQEEMDICFDENGHRKKNSANANERLEEIHMQQKWTRQPTYKRKSKPPLGPLLTPPGQPLEAYEAEPATHASYPPREQVVLVTHALDSRQDGMARFPPAEVLKPSAPALAHPSAQHGELNGQFYTSVDSHSLQPPSFDSLEDPTSMVARSPELYNTESGLCLVEDRCIWMPANNPARFGNEGYCPDMLVNDTGQLYPGGFMCRSIPLDSLVVCDALNPTGGTYYAQCGLGEAPALNMDGTLLPDVGFEDFQDCNVGNLDLNSSLDQLFAEVEAFPGADYGTG